MQMDISLVDPWAWIPIASHMEFPLELAWKDTNEIRMGNETHPSGTPMGLPMEYDLREFIQPP